MLCLFNVQKGRCLRRKDKCRRLFRTMSKKKKTDRKGRTGDKCLNVKEYKTRQVLGQQMWPYAIAYYSEHLWTVKWPWSISHLCGSKLCINPRHLHKELQKINLSRTRCHGKLREKIMSIIATERWRRRWLNGKERRKLKGKRFIKRDKYTFLDLFGYSCPHTPACFVSEGQTNSRRRWSWSFH